MGRAITMEKEIAKLKNEMSEIQGVLKEILDTVKTEEEVVNEPKKTKKTRSSGSSASSKRDSGDSKDTSGTD